MSHDDIYRQPGDFGEFYPGSGPGQVLEKNNK